MMEPKFLSIEKVLRLHAMLVEDYGGSAGIRDRGLLESALAAPESGFGDEYFHKTLHAMAAAYLYHICANHPFVDGNKRTAAMSAYSFLVMNGYEVTADQQEFEDLVVRVASGQAQKPEIEEFLVRNTRRRA